MRTLTIDELLAAYEQADPKEKQRIRKELRRRGTSIRAPYSGPATPVARTAAAPVKEDLTKAERATLTVPQMLSLMQQMWKNYNTTDHFDQVMVQPNF